MWRTTNRLIEGLIPDTITGHQQLRWLFNRMLSKFRPAEGDDYSLYYEPVPKEVWPSHSITLDQLRAWYFDLESSGHLTIHPVPALFAAAGLKDPDDKRFSEWAPLLAHLLLSLAESEAANSHTQLITGMFRRAMIDPDHHAWFLDLLGTPKPGFIQNLNLIKGLYKSVAADEQNAASILPDNASRRLLEVQRAIKHALRWAPIQYQPDSEVDGSKDTEELIADESSKKLTDDRIVDWLNTSGKAGFISRRKHHFWNDDRGLPPADTKLLCSKLIPEVNDRVPESIAIYLALISGQSILFWTDILANPEIDRPSCLRINNERNTCLLERCIGLPEVERNEKFSDFYLNESKVADYILLPMPIDLVRFCITTEHKLSQEHINSKLKKLRKLAGIPYLSPHRVETTLYRVLKREVKDQVTADILTGADPNHQYALHYVSYRIQELLRCYKEAVTVITGNYPIDTSYLIPGDRDYGVGSQKSLGLPLIIAFMKILKQRVEDQPDPIAKMNAHTFWIWHVFMLLTSVRAVSALPGTLNELDFEGGWVWISDKEEVAGEGVYGRLIPLCHFLVTALKNYVNHLTRCLREQGIFHTTALKYRDKVLTAEAPVFALCVGNQWMPVRLKNVLRFYNDEFPNHDNWTRHFGRWFLSDEACPIGRQLTCPVERHLSWPVDAESFCVGL